MFLYYLTSRSWFSNSRSEDLKSKIPLREVGQQSLFDCQRPLVTTFDQVSKLQHSSQRLNAQVSRFQILQSEIQDRMAGGGEGIRTPDPRVANAVLCQLSYTPEEEWLRGRDLNPRPLGYEPNELPDCSTPRQSQLNAKPENGIRNQHCKIRNRWWAWVDSNYRPHAYQACALTN